MTADAPLRSVRASAFTVPTDSPEADGTLAWESTTLVLVEIDAGEAIGIGWTYAPAAAVRVVEDLLAPVLREASATAPATASQAMVKAVRNAGRPGLVGMALSAVDIALWDACARLHEVPLTRLWGYQEDQVEVYGSGGFTTYDDQQTRAQLEHWTELGCHERQDQDRRIVGATPRARPASGGLGSRRSWATRSASSSTPTAPTPPARRAVSVNGSTTSRWGGSRNRSPPTTCRASAGSATTCRPTSRPVSTATT